MAYKLFDAAGQEITFHDLQDKGPWCQTGVSIENTFVSKFGAKLGVTINPSKTNDAYSPDLLEVGSSILADLKTQNTPFFQANQRFGLDPQRVVVFNKKDADRYERLYPAIIIYFWVDWQAVRFESGAQIIQVNPMSEVWRIPFPDLQKLLQKAPLHFYAQRRNDNLGNAKSSYVLNLADPKFAQVV